MAALCRFNCISGFTAIAVSRRVFPSPVYFDTASTVFTGFRRPSAFFVIIGDLIPVYVVLELLRAMTAGLGSPFSSFLLSAFFVR